MARQARRLAVSGIYHVMVRGIGRQALFHSVADNLAFLSAVTFALQRTQVQLLNYCLMSNHVHLMLKLRQADRTSTAALSQCLKIIETRYAAYYNNTYEREGPLLRGGLRPNPLKMNIICLLHGATYCAILPRQALPRPTPIHGAVTLIILVPVIPIRLLIRLICLPATAGTSCCSRLAALTIRKGSWNHPPQKRNAAIPMWLPRWIASVAVPHPLHFRLFRRKIVPVASLYLYSKGLVYASLPA